MICLHSQHNMVMLNHHHERILATRRQIYKALCRRFFSVPITCLDVPTFRVSRRRTLDLPQPFSSSPQDHLMNELTETLIRLEYTYLIFYSAAHSDAASAHPSAHQPATVYLSEQSFDDLRRSIQVICSLDDHDDMM